MNHEIYTIGYGARSMEEFIQLLHQYRISNLIDVRSTPYSKYNPGLMWRGAATSILNLLGAQQIPT